MFLITILFSAISVAYEEQVYNDYFLRLPDRSEFLNVASFQVAAVAHLAWTGGERRPEPPLDDALSLCSLPLDLLRPVVADCPGLVLTAFRLCAKFDEKRFSDLGGEAMRIFDSDLTPLQRDVVSAAQDPFVSLLLSNPRLRTIGHTKYLSKPGSLREAANSVIAFHLRFPGRVSRETALSLALGSVPERATAVAKLERSIPALVPVIIGFVEYFYDEAVYLRDSLELELALHNSMCDVLAPTTWKNFISKLVEDVDSLTEALVDSKSSRSLGTDVLSRRPVGNSDKESVYWEIVAPLVHACEISRRLSRSLPSGLQTWRFIRNLEISSQRLGDLVCEMAHFSALGLQPGSAADYRPYEVDAKLAKRMARECPDAEYPVFDVKTHKTL